MAEQTLPIPPNKSNLSIFLITSLSYFSFPAISLFFLSFFLSNSYPFSSQFCIFNFFCVISVIFLPLFLSPILKNELIEGRLIIRNLVFDINEKHLKSLFTKYGEIKEISLPINPSTNKPKGFAFIQFDNKNHALKAIKVH